MLLDNPESAAKDQLNLVMGFFSRVDAKLSVLFVVSTGMLGVLATHAAPVSVWTWPMIISAGLATILIGVAIFWIYKGAFPNLDGGALSLVYFREIAMRTEYKFIEEFKAQAQEHRVNDLLGQVWRNSEILTIKFKAIKKSFTILAIATLPWVCALSLFAAARLQAGLNLVPK